MRQGRCLQFKMEIRWGPELRLYLLMPGFVQLVAHSEMKPQGERSGRLEAAGLTVEPVEV